LFCSAGIRKMAFPNLRREKSEQTSRDHRAAYSERFPAFPSDLEKITDLARVPQKQRRYFQDRLIMSLKLVWCSYNILPQPSKDSSLSRAFQAAVSLHEALAELTPAERERVDDVFHHDHFRWNAGWREIAFRLGENLRYACGGEIGLRPVEEGPRPKRKGRRPGTVKNPQFGEFVLNFVCDTFFDGGRLTFEKNGPSGSLTRIIDLLTPYLPSGFVPDPLPGSSMRTWWKQGRAKSLEHPSEGSDNEPGKYPRLQR
jgi:hypothetical protein